MPSKRLIAASVVTVSAVPMVALLAAAAFGAGFPEPTTAVSSTDWTSTGALIGVVVAILAAGVSYGVLQSRSTTNAEGAATANAVANAAITRIEALERLHYLFREEVAREYASRESIEVIENRFAGRVGEAITNVGGMITLLRADINRLGERIDQAFDGRSAPRRGA